MNPDGKTTRLVGRHIVAAAAAGDGGPDGVGRRGPVRANQLRDVAQLKVRAGISTHGIAKLANGSLIIVGEQGTIGLSADNGVTWEKIASPYEGSFYGALPAGPTGATLYGLRGNVFTAADLKGSAASVPAAASTDAKAAPTQPAAPAEAGPSPFTAVTSNTVASFFGGTTMPDGGTALVGLSGMVMKLDASGSTKQVKVKIKEIDGYGKEQEKDITGSFSAAVAFAGGLVVVGEQGVQSIKLN